MFSGTGISIRSVFLSGIGAIFFIAFNSYYVQFPGLLSSSGIEPAGRIFPKVFSRFHNSFFRDDHLSHHDEGMKIREWLQVDLMCEGVSILGALLSAIAAR